MNYSVDWDGPGERDIEPADCDDEFHMGADFSGRGTCPTCGGKDMRNAVDAVAQTLAPDLKRNSVRGVDAARRHADRLREASTVLADPFHREAVAHTLLETADLIDLLCVIIDGQAQSISRNTEDKLRLAVDVVRRANDEEQQAAPHRVTHDHACGLCRPEGGGLVTPGFICTVHLARQIIKETSGV